MTSNYLTASRARHVTFQSVSYWAMGRSILSLHYILLILVAHTRLETIAIVVFLAIILVNTCSFFCTLIASWQVGLVISHPCLLPEFVKH